MLAVLFAVGSPGTIKSDKVNAGRIRGVCFDEKSSMKGITSNMTVNICIKLTFCA